MLNPKNMIIMRIESFMGNPHDSQTIQSLLQQLKRELDYQPDEVVYDRGSR